MKTRRQFIQTIGAAYDAAPADPISDEEIERLVSKATAESEGE